MTFQEKVVQFFEERKGIWFSENAVSSALSPGEGEQSLLTLILKDLAAVGYLVRKRNNYLKEKAGRFLPGIFSAIKGGGGFLICRGADKDDIFVPKDSAGGAMGGDLVICRIEGKGRKPEGYVVYIVRRSRKKVAGIVSDGFLLPFGNFYPVAADTRSAKKGSVAVAELDEDSRGLPKAKTIDVIGDPYDIKTPVKAVETSFGLSMTFPKGIEKEADAFGGKVKEEWISGRRDYRELVTITIDPSDAKDFDDAISIEKNGDGSFRLFVHIADVSFYVREGSMLDSEARSRGNSVYLPGTVYPMLPHNLSDKLCSLNENEDRLCVTCEMTVEGSGKVKRSFFFESVIKSAKRLSYEEAEEIIDGAKSLDKKIDETVKTGHELAGILTRRRSERGALDFDLPEPFLNFDEKGKLKNILPSLRLKSHRLIEEFMLLANTETAEYLKKKKQPFIYRVHEEPDEEKLESILPILNILTLGASFKKKADPQRLMRSVIEAAKGKPFERLVSYQILRAMMRARYSEEESSHYGLALTRYCHFTSPIRRYPDLLVHRAVKAAIKGVEFRQNELAEIAAHASETERIADEAEREAVEWLTLIYLKPMVGDDFKTMITGFTKYGVKLELVDELIEGVCPFSLMDSDHFLVEPSGFSARGKYTSKLFKVGQVVSAKLVRIDLFNKEAQFAINI
jgi:ribonuclease R